MILSHLFDRELFYEKTFFLSGLAYKENKATVQEKKQKEKKRKFAWMKGMKIKERAVV